MPHVSCIEPSVFVQYFIGAFRVFVISLHYYASPDIQHTVSLIIGIHNLLFQGRDYLSYRLLFVCSYRIQVGYRRSLCQSIALDKIQAQLIEPSEGGGWKRASSGNTYSYSIQRSFFKNTLTEELLSQVYSCDLFYRPGQFHEEMDQRGL